MTNDVPESLKAQFKVAFGFPPTRHRLKTERAQWFWIDMSPQVDDLAGPLWKILNTGRCAYVYEREDRYFRGVDTPEDLRAVWEDWHAALCAALGRFEPTCPEEEADLFSMRLFTADIRAVGLRLLGIEEAAWRAAQSG